MKTAIPDLIRMVAPTGCLPLREPRIRFSARICLVLPVIFFALFACPATAGIAIVPASNTARSISSVQQSQDTSEQGETVQGAVASESESALVDSQPAEDEAARARLRYTRKGWQDPSSWIQTNSQGIPYGIYRVHPVLVAMEILLLVAGSMIWASNEWELSQVFGDSYRRTNQAQAGGQPNAHRRSKHDSE